MPAFTEEQKAFIREVTYEVVDKAAPRLIAQHKADCTIERTAEAEATKGKSAGTKLAIIAIVIAALSAIGGITGAYAAWRTVP